MKVRAYKLFDYRLDNWRSEIEDRYEYVDFKRNENLRIKWISFDGVMADAAPDLVYVGREEHDRFVGPPLLREQQGAQPVSRDIIGVLANIIHDHPSWLSLKSRRAETI